MTMRRFRQAVCLLGGFVFLMALGNGTLGSAQEQSYVPFFNNSLNQNGKRPILPAYTLRSRNFTLRLWSTGENSEDRSSRDIGRGRGSGLGKLAAGAVWGVGGFVYGFLVGAKVYDDQYPESSSGDIGFLGWGLGGGAIGTAICLPTGIYLANRQFEHFRGGRQPLVAVIISPILPSTGHLYAGCWGRGLLFAAGRLGCLIFMEAKGEKRVHRETYPYGSIEYELTAWFYAGVAAFLGTTIWEAVDAQNQIDKYNRRHYGQSQVPGSFADNFRIRAIPTRDGLSLLCTYSF
jgi:hypothetical protein